MKTQWTPLNGRVGSMTVVEGLGLIEIYRDKSGWCVDINGKRAWSTWRDSERGIQLGMNDMIHTWQYLNSLRAP